MKLWRFKVETFFSWKGAWFLFCSVHDLIHIHFMVSRSFLQVLKRHRHTTWAMMRCQFSKVEWWWWWFKQNSHNFQWWCWQEIRLLVKSGYFLNEWPEMILMLLLVCWSVHFLVNNIIISIAIDVVVFVVFWKQIGHVPSFKRQLQPAPF